jgi:hypothetical protein
MRGIISPPRWKMSNKFFEQQIDALEMTDGKRDKNPSKKHGNIPL